MTMILDEITYPNGTDERSSKAGTPEEAPAMPQAVAVDDSIEARLLDRIAAGDEQAFAAMYRQHVGRVHRIALRMTGSAADADDLTQRVFEKAWTALPDFKARARISTWLYRVTVNASLDLLRARKRRPLSDAQSLDSVDPKRGPESLVASAQTAALVERAILRLPEKYRVVVILRDIEGRPYKEIRSILRLPITTLKMRAVRGREQLSRIIERMGGR